MDRKLKIKSANIPVVHNCLIVFLYCRENEGSAGSRVDIYQKLQEKKQKQLAELKIIEEEIKQGKLGGPVGSNKFTLNGEQQSSLPRQPIPNVKKHINIEPNEWRTSSPELCGGVSVGSLMNDLNVNITSANVGDINNLIKYTHNYGSIYNGFQLESNDLPFMVDKVKSTIVDNAQRNISPISSQSSAVIKNHAMLRQIIPPRTKTAHDVSRTRPYRANFTNIFADNFNSADEKGQILNLLSNSSPNRNASTSNSNNEESIEANGVKLAANKNEADHSYSMHHVQKQHRIQLQRPIQHQVKTTEIVLAPQYLDNSTVYFDWENPGPSTYRLKMQKSQERQQHISDCRNDDRDSTLDRDEYRIPSDIDSQVRTAHINT